MKREHREQMAARLDALADRLATIGDEARSKATDPASLIAPEHRGQFIDNYVHQYTVIEVNHAIRVLRTEASIVRPKRRRTVKR